MFEFFLSLGLASLALFILGPVPRVFHKRPAARYVKPEQFSEML